MHFNKKIKFKKHLIEIKLKKKIFNINNRYYFGYPIGKKNISEQKV